MLKYFVSSIWLPESAANRVQVEGCGSKVLQYHGDGRPSETLQISITHFRGLIAVA